MKTNPGTLLKAALKSDEELIEEQKIKDAFEKYAGIDTCAVMVEVHGHSVRITGEVDSLLQKDDAETLTWMAMPDAEDVDNELKVEAESDREDDVYMEI